MTQNSCFADTRIGHPQLAVLRLDRRLARVILDAASKLTDARLWALTATATALRTNASTILEANGRDVAAARAAGHGAAFVDRLALGAKSIDAMARGLEEIAALPDPGNQTGAARLLGLSRFGLQKKLRRLWVPSSARKSRRRPQRGHVRLACTCQCFFST